MLPERGQPTWAPGTRGNVVRVLVELDESRTAGRSSVAVDERPQVVGAGAGAAARTAVRPARG
jgi:hypothetical protein